MEQLHIVAGAPQLLLGMPIGASRPDSDFSFFPARSGGRRDAAFSLLAPTQASGTSDTVRR